MSILKSFVGLILAAVYLLIAIAAFLHDLARTPGPLILFDEFLVVVALPGLLFVAGPLELLGVKRNEGALKTPVLIASAVLTAGMVYLVGLGIEILYRAISRWAAPPNNL